MRACCARSLESFLAIELIAALKAVVTSSTDRTETLFLGLLSIV